MKNIWAPWRMEYILGPKEKECIFCVKPREDDYKKNLIVCRGKHNYVMLNLYPYNNGHLMVVPYRHTGDVLGLASDEAEDMMNMVKKCVLALRGAFKPQGFNIGMNLEAASGAGIEEHIHMHVVPRWNGDTNFMSVVADTRVIPQHLQSTYEAIAGHFPLDE